MEHFVQVVEPVLNAMARAFMTFGGVYIGGYKSRCITDNKLTWAWTNGQTYLQEDTESYGKLLGTVTSYYNEQYNISSGKKPME